MTILQYLRHVNGNARYNHLVKLGCTKKQAAQIKNILSRSEIIDLYNYSSEICEFLHIANFL
jgi:hypothetical protein